jgi:hypothetical protein
MPVHTQRKSRLLATLLQCIPLLGPGFVLGYEHSTGDVRSVVQLGILPSAFLFLAWGCGYLYLGRRQRFFATIGLAVSACMLLALVGLAAFVFTLRPDNRPGIGPTIGSAVFFVLLLVPLPGLVTVTAIDAWRLAGAQNRQTL